MNPEHMAECGHRIMRSEFPDYRELFRESDIKSAVAFFRSSFSISMRCSFFQLTYFDLFWCHIRRGFWCFALTLITQLFDPSCHCGKANIHSFGGICHRVVLVNNQLSGFAFKLCAEISFFSLKHLCCSEVSISPLFRWPNSVCHFTFPRFGSSVRSRPESLSVHQDASAFFVAPEALYCAG